MFLPVLITARLGSSRLASKHLQAMRDGVSAIVCLIGRLKRQAQPLVLCIPEGEEDDPLAAIATAQGIGCFRGDRNNVLVRYGQAMAQLDGPAAIVVDADDAFVSVEAIAGIAAIYEGHDVITCVGMPYGGAPYLLSRRFVDAMLAADTTSSGWSRYLQSLPGKKLALDDFAVAPVEQGYRLSLDYEEDLAFMRHIYGACPGGDTIRLNDVVAYITAHHDQLARQFPALFDGTLDERARQHLG